VLDFEDFVVVRMLVSGLSLGLGGRQHFSPLVCLSCPRHKSLGRGVADREQQGRGANLVGVLSLGNLDTRSVRLFLKALRRPQGGVQLISGEGVVNRCRSTWRAIYEA
jgi:hypothetical protein